MNLTITNLNKSFKIFYFFKLKGKMFFGYVKGGGMDARM